MRIDSLYDLPAQYHEQIREQVDLTLELTPAKRKPSPRKIEWAEQCAFFDQVNAAAQAGLNGADMIFAIANEMGFGGRGGLKIGADRKRAGRRPGIPDICVPVPQGDCPGLWIELKQPGGKPSDVSPAQREWHRKLRSQGHKVEVCFGWRAAYDVASAYLGWDDIERAKALARVLALENNDGA